MSFNFSQQLPITDGLVFYLDASNIERSYPVSGSVSSSFWKSIGKESSIGYFYSQKPPTYNSNYFGKKAIVFDSGDENQITGSMGVDDWLNQNKTGKLTVEIYFYIGNSQSDRVLFSVGGNDSAGTSGQYAIGITGTSDIRPYIASNAGTFTGATISNSTNRWNYTAVCFSDTNLSSNTNIYYNNINDRIESVNKHELSNGNNPTERYWQIGRTGTRYFTGGINLIRVYNRILSIEEIQLNYDYSIQRKF